MAKKCCGNSELWMYLDLSIKICQVSWIPPPWFTPHCQKYRLVKWVCKNVAFTATLHCVPHNNVAAGIVYKNVALF